MPTSPYFSKPGPKSEQQLYADLNAEIVKIHGHDFYYIPRDSVNTDQLFGEDIAANFNDAYPIEMYVETTDGWEGNDIFQKFGVEIRDETTVAIAKHRFKEILSNTPHNTLLRPREGDLVFLPMSNHLFEITFVEHEQPFYMFGSTPMYKFNMALFELSNEDIDVNIVGLDLPSPDQTEGQGIEAKNYMLKLTMASNESFQLGEEASQTVSGTTITGEIVKIENSGGVLYMTHIRHDDTSDDYQIFVAGGTLTGSVSSASATISSVVHTAQSFAKNDEIESIADSVLDFSEGNPFGEV